MLPTQQLIQRLVDQGERMTPIRRTLLGLFVKNPHPISALELLVQLNKRSFKANKTTVYRQLATLQRYGIVHEVRLADRSVRYELAVSKRHHHHLVCVECRKVEDVSFAEDLERQAKIIKKTKKFTVLQHSLEFFGVCARCQK